MGMSLKKLASFVPDDAAEIVPHFAKIQRRSQLIGVSKHNQLTSGESLSNDQLASSVASHG